MNGKYWNGKDISSAAGMNVLVTGGTSGIGFEIVHFLACAGARVIFTGRFQENGNRAVQLITSEFPQAHIQFLRHDISSLQEVRILAETVTQIFPKLDILVNCAGVTRLRPRQLSSDGYEMQFATNYLGHFALTAYLFPVLKKSPHARIISVSSIAHKAGILQFDDLQGEIFYCPTQAYRQSKLAQLVFALELQRRLTKAGLPISSIPAHPGLSLTNIYQTVFSANPLLLKLVQTGVSLIGQSAAMGALPVLYAALAEEAIGGHYYGPKGFMDLKGYPAEAHIAPQALNEEDAVRLWTISEELSGFHFPVS